MVTEKSLYILSFLAISLGMFGCGSDEQTSPGVSGSGGSAGNANGGSGGAAVDGGSGGTANVGGAAGMGGNGGTGGGNPLEPPVEASNQIIMRNQSPQTLTNYPFQFGRPFLQGEIKAFPVVYANDTPIPTQTDIKQRWPDGSVRFAIVSVVIDALEPNATMTLKFGEQSTSDNTPLTTAEMLDPVFDFDAQMALTSGGQTVSASARKMLTDGKAIPWVSGPIATTVILADHSKGRVYDLGFDTYRSIRPIFEATFWPRTHQVRIRFIGENANTTTLQDVAYDLALTTGSTAPKSFYTRANVPHYFGTRWTKVAWIPAAPESNVLIDFGLPYLAQSQFMPNFDTSRTVPEERLAALAASWSAADKELFDTGMWTPYMPTTGGRAEIAPYPSWTNLWLRTGDPRAREAALGQADLAGSWPLHWREGDEQTKFDRKKTIPGLGMPISVNAHPDIWFPDNNGNYHGILPTPRISPKTPWVADGAHQPDPFSPQYILTGDHFYLEQIQLWAAAQTVAYPYGQYGRGLNGYGGIQDQIRGNGWVIRNRVNAAFLSPDGTPEKTYFHELIEDAFALWEGQRNIQGTPLANHPQWAYGHDTIPVTASPLHIFDRGIDLASTSLNGLDPNTTSRITALWQHYYFLIELGVARDRGFPAEPLLKWLAPVLNGQFTDPGYDPVLCRMYMTPIADVNGNYFPTWADIANAIPQSTYEAQKTAGGSNYYPLLAASAASATYWEPGGEEAWAWLSTHVRATSQTDYGTEWFSWDLLPRPEGTKPLPPSTP